MRVLLTNHFPFHGSGTGTYTYDLAKGLLAAGHEVQCLIVDHRPRGQEPFPVRRIVCRAGEPVADLPFDFPCFTSHPHSRQTFYDLSDDQIALYREVVRHRLDEQVARFDPHVIHCQHIWIQGHLALETGVPYVLSAQGTDLMGYRRDPRYRPFADQAAENAGRILAASSFIREQVLATFDVPSEQVETLPSAIDVEPYQQPPGARGAVLARLGLPPDAKPLVAYVGKLVPFKGVDTLLNAAAIYERAGAPITTAIVGDGIQRDELELHARRLGLAHVVFCGDRGRDDCAQLYAAADLVVMPSRGEPFGLVALEAMASGTPVVGTLAGGLAEIVTEATGGLVRVDDHELLAEMVLRAIRENWKLNKGPAARRYVLEAHHPRVWVERIVGVYQRVLHERFGRATWQE